MLTRERFCILNDEVTEHNQEFGNISGVDEKQKIVMAVDQC